MNRFYFGILLITGMLVITLMACNSDPRYNYRFDEKDISYLNKNDGIKLSGTLTMPLSESPVPAVLLVQGTGPHDRDETIGRHKLFKVLAHHLAKKGVAVLRTDKRGCGRSEGKYVFCDIENFVDDGFVGVEYLKSQSAINKSNIGIVGHSLGGLIAANMAKESQDISFIVSLASTGFWGRDILYDQNKLWARYSGVSEDDFDDIKSLCFRMYDLALQDTVTTNEEIEFATVYNRLTQYLDDDLRNSFYPKPAEIVLKTMRTPAFQESFQIDPGETWRGISCKTLLLRGSLDHNVSEESNRKIIDELTAGGNIDVTSIFLENHNHHFQYCKSGRPSEVQSIKETISKKSLNTITSWIVKNTYPLK